MKTLALPIGWILGVVTVIAMGFAPDPYLEVVRQIPPPHPYPTQTVLWILLFMTVHAGATFAILRPTSYCYSWGRSFLAALVSSGFFIFAAFGAMHAPLAHFAYIWWLLAFWLVTFGLFVWSAICDVRRRFLPNNSLNPDAPRRAG
jgi:hypothetical protein